MNLEESPEQQKLRTGAASVLRRTSSPTRCATAWPRAARAARPGARWCARSARTAGSASAGPRSSAVRAGRRQTSSLFGRDSARGPLPSSPSTTSARPSCDSATEEQKSFFLPQILGRRVELRIGYTEPEAGTDPGIAAHACRCATARSTSSRGKDLHQRCRPGDYVWLACRTDPDVPKHKGISILCVPTTSPGFDGRSSTRSVG